MNRRWFTLCLLLALLASGATARFARAAGAFSEIRIPEAPFGSVGVPVRIPVFLLDETGGALPEQPLVLAVDGRPTAWARTDSSGRAVFRLPGTLDAGTYAIEVVFSGSRDHAAAAATTDLVVDPAQITVQILPPIAGVDLALDGEPFSSGPDGIARTPVDRAGDHQLEVFTPDSGVEQIHFAGWESGETGTVRQLRVSGDQVLQAGFEILYRAVFVFLSPAEVIVPDNRITSIEISSSTGRYRILDPGEPVWLEANAIFNRLSGLDSVAITHAVQEVLMDGSNVVNRGQQRFILQRNGEVRLDLLLYDAVFTANDFMFAGPIDGELALTYPDGQVRSYKIGADGHVALPALARGSYEARLIAEDSVALDLPVVLSRDQAIRMPAVKKTNLALLGALVLLQVALLAAASRLRKNRYLEEVRSGDA